MEKQENWLGYDSPNQNELFLGGLPLKVDDEDLRSYFSQFGRVQYAFVKKNKRYQKSKGYGYLAMENPLHAKTILMSACHKIEGRKIDIQYSQRKSREGRTIGRPKNPERLFIMNLPSNLDEEGLKTIFSEFGSVRVSYLLLDKNTSLPTGDGCVQYKNIKEHKVVLARGEVKYNDTVMKVFPFSQKTAILHALQKNLQEGHQLGFPPEYLKLKASVSGRQEASQPPGQCLGPNLRELPLVVQDHTSKSIYLASRKRRLNESLQNYRFSLDARQPNFRFSSSERARSDGNQTVPKDKIDRRDFLSKKRGNLEGFLQSGKSGATQENIREIASEGWKVVKPYPEPHQQ